VFALSPHAVLQQALSVAALAKRWAQTSMLAVQTNGRGRCGYPVVTEFETICKGLNTTLRFDSFRNCIYFGKQSFHINTLIHFKTLFTLHFTLKEAALATPSSLAKISHFL